jgi:myxalamid-type polyketide synthase MxaB
VSGGASHPYLGHRVQSPLQQIQFEAAFSLRTLPLVGDHRILGMPWLNLVLYLEMAAAAAVECHGAGPIVLKDVAVLRPLILREDESRPVHLVLSIPKEGAAAFEIHSLSTTRDGQSAGNGSWLLHAQGSVTLAGQGEPAAAADPIRLDDARARCTDEISRGEFYAAMEQHGVSLGPACRWLDRLWRGESEALGRIRAERPNELDRRYVLNLGAIDACFQLLGALLPPGSPSDYVLSGLESFRCWPQDKPLDLWAHARLVAHDETAGTLTAHVNVFDQAGHIVAAIDNAQLQRVGLAAVGPQTQYRGEPITIVRGPRLSIDDLLAAPPERAPELLVEYLTAMLAQSLGVAVSEINGDTPLAAQIDSLVAVEMKTQIERDLDLAVPVAAFFDGNSIRELAGTLCAELKTFAAAASGDEMEDLLGEIERMSDDEAQARAAAQRPTDQRHLAHE